MKRPLKTISLFILCVILCLTVNSCSFIKPLLEIPEMGIPLFDVLKPGVEVDILKINEDGTVVVTAEFMVWVVELKQEIQRLRDKVEEEWQEN